MRKRSQKMVITYLRNSDVKQKNSTNVQLEQVENYCNQNNLKLDEIYIDKDLSGSKSDRGKYQEVIELIKSGQVDTLIVLSLSRLTRSVRETCLVIELMKNTDTNLISLKENIDMKTPTGIFFTQVMSSINELEISQLSQRTSDSLKSLKKNGKVYSKVPYGFTRQDNNLITNEKEKKVLDKMYRLKDKGNSYQNISDFLNRNNHQTKSGGVWNRILVFNIMKTERVFV
jgi:DNA invertase Pin-like site-specific DNA recombinase